MKMFKSYTDKYRERAENARKAYLYDMMVAKEEKDKKNKEEAMKKLQQIQDNVIKDPMHGFCIDIKEIGASIISARAELIKARMEGYIDGSDFDSCKSRVDQIEKHVLKIIQRFERDSDDEK